MSMEYVELFVKVEFDKDRITVRDILEMMLELNTDILFAEPCIIQKVGDRLIIEDTTTHDVRVVNILENLDRVVLETVYVKLYIPTV